MSETLLAWLNKDVVLSKVILQYQLENRFH